MIILVDGFSTCGTALNELRSFVLHRCFDAALKCLRVVPDIIIFIIIIIIILTITVSNGNGFH